MSRSTSRPNREPRGESAGEPSREPAGDAASDAASTPASEGRWLTEDEQHAWRRLAAVILRLPAELEGQLQRDAGMSHFEYWVLALLSEAEDGSLRLSHLAAQANASLSRLSHVVTRLERRGWVRRQRDPADARATHAALTEPGHVALVAAAPEHVATVRRLVFDALAPGDVDQLGRICDAILDEVDGRGGPMTA